MHGNAVILVLHEPDQGTLELVELRIAVTAHPHVRGAVVEAVERIIRGGVDPGRPPGKSPDINDRIRRSVWHIPSRFTRTAA